jgi:rare lipoprotein A
MKARVFAISLVAIIAYGCVSTVPPAEPKPADTLHGIASWYGEEFAGRTTANGEIFDPLLLTAAHRTMPFGTILDITNPKTSQTVRVRVNDRGPYIGNRIIDLSYAAAQQIGLIEPGIGEVDIKVVKVGSGEREAPAPLEVTIAEMPVVAATPAPSAPATPARPRVEPPPPPVPVVVDRVEVEEVRGGMVTRKQVADDGRTIESVPVKPSDDAAPPASSYDEQRRAAARAPAAVKKGQFVVQVGAFAVEENAKSLQARLATIGQRAFIDHHELFRVRLGPFTTREQALQARTALEANGMSAIIVAE